MLFGAAGALLAASASASSKKTGVAHIEGGVSFWVVVLCVFGIAVISSHWQDPPIPSHRQPAVGGNYQPGGGYENPAPGNDGSFDCPPGGGPVYVGSNDPAGLDGDGDGTGCE